MFIHILCSKNCAYVFMTCSTSYYLCATWFHRVYFLFIHICMYVDIYIYMHVCIYVMYVHMYVRMYV